jgi:hypothetical protein
MEVRISGWAEIRERFEILKSFFGSPDKRVNLPGVGRDQCMFGRSGREFETALDVPSLVKDPPPSSFSRFVIGACAPIHPASVHAARSDPGPGGLAFALPIGGPDRRRQRHPKIGQRCE